MAFMFYGQRSSCVPDMDKQCVWDLPLLMPSSSAFFCLSRSILAFLSCCLRFIFSRIDFNFRLNFCFFTILLALNNDLLCRGRAPPRQRSEHIWK